MDSTRWKRALITGASAGIGEAFARHLASEGSDLVLVARRGERLEKLAGELPVECEVVVADLTDATEIKEVENRLGDDEHPIDLLVNNAGGGTVRARFVDHDRDHVEDVAVLNALAVHRLTHAAASAMLRRGGGHIVQVSAGVAFYPVPGGATYAASKAFVNSFSEAVNKELEGTGVSISVVCPGFTRTEAPGRIGFTEDNIPRALWADPEEVVRAALDGARRGRAVVVPTRLGRITTPILRHLPRRVMVNIAARTAIPKES